MAYWGEDWWGPRSAPSWRVTLVTPPVLDPITLADAKMSARIRTDDEDWQVANWIKAATRKVEQDTEMALLTQTWDVSLDRFPDPLASLLLPIRPVQTITSVTYYDEAGTLSTMPSGDYILHPGFLMLGLALNASWPSSVGSFRPVVVRLVAGYASPALVPEDLKHAIRLLVGHFSVQREATRDGDKPTAIEFGYDALIAPYVRHRAA